MRHSGSTHVAGDIFSARGAGALQGEGRPKRFIKRQTGWRDRYGIERLREALNDVAECRGLITKRLKP